MNEIQNMKIFKEIDDFINRIEDFTAIPLSGGRVLIPRYELISNCEAIRDLIPKEFETARRVAESYDSIMTSAYNKAEAIQNESRNEARHIVEEATKRANEIIANAEARASLLISENEITKNARLKAGEILSKAEKDAQQIFTKNADRIAHILGEAEKNLISSAGIISQELKKYEKKR